MSFERLLVKSHRALFYGVCFLSFIKHLLETGLYGDRSREVFMLDWVSALCLLGGIYGLLYVREKRYKIRLEKKWVETSYMLFYMTVTWAHMVEWFDEVIYWFYNEGHLNLVHLIVGICSRVSLIYIGGKE